jgi:hypothetical protein
VAEHGPAHRGPHRPAHAVLAPDFDSATVDARIRSHALASGGAAWSPGALEVSGEITRGAVFPWSRVMLPAASQPRQPVDVSGCHELVFRVRGDGHESPATVFSHPSTQAMPCLQAFTAGQPQRACRFRLDHVELRWAPRLQCRP